MPRDRGVQKPREAHTEDTLGKVYFGLAAAGITGQQAIDAVNQMQNRGVVFRENRIKVVEKHAIAVDEAIDELANAIRLTVEHTGNDILPAIEGWSWFDALMKYRPDLAQVFVNKPISFGPPNA